MINQLVIIRFWTIFSVFGLIGLC